MAEAANKEGNEVKALDKVPTGIPGFDYVAMGGLPRGRATLIKGGSGSGKTIFGCQFLANGVRLGEGAVFVALEESPEDIRVNMAGLGMDIQSWEAEGRWTFVDATPVVDVEVVEIGSYDLDALLARITDAARRTGAKRMVLDSLGGLFAQFENRTMLRSELLRLCVLLKREGLTVLLLGEQTIGEESPYQLESYLADAVIHLRNTSWENGRRRTLEVLKMRGADHHKGEFPFTIRAGSGIHCIPLSSMIMKDTSSDERMSTGIKELDVMCGGGLFRDAFVLVAGPTGTGKSLAGQHFVAAGTEAGEHCLLVALEESRAQILRNARGWGIDLEALEARGLLTIECDYPESMVIEDHLVRIKTLVEEKQPQRVVMDSLTAIGRIASPNAFQEFVLALAVFLKSLDISMMGLATTSELLGGNQVSEASISTITDAIILMRYADLDGDMRRGVQVLKLRGSNHDKHLRMYTIDGSGLHVGEPLFGAKGRGI